MTNYLDKEWNEAIEKYAKKKAAEFQSEPTLKEKLNEMDWKRKNNERYSNRFWPKRV